MVAAKRDNRNPGVAYSQGKHSAEDFRAVRSNFASLGDAAVMNSEANASADSALQHYSVALKDIVGPDGSKLSIFEALSKLDLSSSLSVKTLVAVRLFMNEDRTCGLRILSYGASKDQKYGSKVGYKSITLESFKSKDEEITGVFSKVSNKLGLDLSFYENPYVQVMRACGRQLDDVSGCQTVVDYCISKSKKPVFRKGLPRTSDPVQAPKEPDTTQV